MTPRRNAGRFVDTLLRAAQRANSTLQIAVTLRVDFFGLCHRYPELWQVAKPASLFRPPDGA
jgi:hypothetical protein